MMIVEYHALAEKRVERTIWVVQKEFYPEFLKQLPSFSSAWLESSQYKASVGSYRLIPDLQGKVESAVISVDPLYPLWSLSPLVAHLPPDFYRIDSTFCPTFNLDLAAIGWGLAGYSFNRYRTSKIEQLSVQKSLSLSLASPLDVQRMRDAIYHIRDLINIPCEDLGPLDLALAARSVAKTYRAKYRMYQGNALLKKGYPAVHMVGRASDREPCFVEMEWGSRKHPTVVLVGKGVCFDTGGLDLKDASSMLLMKKDMGGAAQVLGLSELIMQEKLPVHLYVLIPCVENSVSGASYRPGDIMTTRSGLTVEVMNTDAEGRLILADALTRALELKPGLIIDFATLTGAARIALGPDLPAFFCNHEPLASAILKAAVDVQDPLWRMPLYQPYDDALKGKLADLSNTSSMKLAGAITAALFLQRFVQADIPWAHIDCMAWNDVSKPGRPEGGEAMGVRAVFEYLKRTYVIGH